MLMRRVGFALIICLLAQGSSQACGRRGHFGRCHRQTTYSRQVFYQPTTYQYPSAVAPQPFPVAPQAPSPLPIMAAPTQVPPRGAEAVQPSYTYEASPTNGNAYYYTYDSSGKLIVQQWMDWLFRGGKEAGMPRPPLPIIGRLQRN